MQLRSTAIVVTFARISNGVACLSRLAVVRPRRKNLLFFTFSVCSVANRAGGVVTSREKNVGRRREGNYLKVSLGSHPLCDKGRALARPAGSLLGLENTPLAHLPLGPSHRPLHPSAQPRRDVASEHRLDKRFCAATPTDLRTATRKYFVWERLSRCD